MNNKRAMIGIKVSKNTMIGNGILSIVKVFIGIIANSNAMVADGIHSLSDFISTIGVILGLKFSSKPADDDHQYGHEKIESLVAIFLAIMLFLISIGIGFSAIKNIVNKNFVIPGTLAIFAALLSIIVKEWMYNYTIKYASILNSPSMKADAWHHRSDSLSSIGVLIGIIGSRMGFTILDPLVSILISILIIKVSIEILKQGIEQIIDKAADKNTVDKMIKNIKSVKGVKNIDNIKTRLHANKIYVDLEISVDSDLTVSEGHNIAQIVHNLIEEDINVKHCMVHINPFNSNNKG